MTKTQEMKGIVRFALWGAVGFGVGGAICGIALHYPYPFLPYFIIGAIGGAALGLALGSWKKAGLLALVGAIGFGVGFSIGFAILFGIWEPPHVEGLFFGVVGGGIGGLSLGPVLRIQGGIRFLALAGAIGFGVIAQAIWSQNFRLPIPMLGLAIKFGIEGIVGGAFLGVALGYLEKRRADRGGD